jgi:hypothetical protein
MHKIKTLPPKKKEKKGLNSTKFVPGIYTLLSLSLSLSLSSSHTLDTHHHQKQNLAT